MESDKSLSFSNYINLLSLNNTNSFSIPVSSKNKNLNNKSLLSKNSHFICRNCFNVPNINFITLTKMKYSCYCYNTEYIDIKEIIKKNIIKENEKENNGIFYGNFKKYLQCIKHDKNFYYYCLDCKENLCEDCLGKTKTHKIHDLFYYDLNFYKTDTKIKNINEIFTTKLKKLKFEESIICNFMDFLNIIFNDYMNHPNYYHFIIIDNLNDFSEKLSIDGNNNEVLKIYENKKDIKILTRKILFEYLQFNSIENVTEIIIRKSNVNDITPICKSNLINLRILELNDNCIVNIEPLKYAKFKDILKINLGENKIGNDNIPVLFELYFKKLNELNIYLNNFTDKEIFKLRNNKDNLPELERLFFGSIKIDWNNDKNNNEIKYDLSSVTVIGLTNGIFNNNSIFFIERFIFTKLETLYINRNNIKSLDFIDKLDLPSITYISIHTTLIKDFYRLNKYKKLKKIDIKDNYISDITNLDNFVKSLIYLEELYMTGNDIDINDKTNKNIINSIKKENKIILYI